MFACAHCLPYGFPRANVLATSRCAARKQPREQWHVTTAKPSVGAGLQEAPSAELEGFSTLCCGQCGALCGNIASPEVAAGSEYEEVAGMYVLHKASLVQVDELLPLEATAQHQPELVSWWSAVCYAADGALRLHSRVREAANQADAHASQMPALLDTVAAQAALAAVKQETDAACGDLRRVAAATEGLSHAGECAASLADNLRLLQAGAGAGTEPLLDTVRKLTAALAVAEGAAQATAVQRESEAEERARAAEARVQVLLAENEELRNGQLADRLAEQFLAGIKKRARCL